MDNEKHLCGTCNAFHTEFCPFNGVVHEANEACDDYLTDECESCKVGE